MGQRGNLWPKNLVQDRPNLPVCVRKYMDIPLQNSNLSNLFTELLWITLIMLQTQEDTSWALWFYMCV